MKIIDAWTHVTPPAYFQRISQVKAPRVQTEVSRMDRIQQTKPHFIDVQKRLEDLDKYSFDMQVTMIHPNIDPTSFMLSNEEELELCRVANDDLARITDTSGGRVIPMGSIPLNNDPEVYTEEMRRAVQELGLKGFMVMTNYKGKPLDEFQPLWIEAERLGSVMYLHPVDPFTYQSRPYEEPYDLAHVFGWPYETTLILSRLIFSNILDKHPNLKIIAHHLGGMIPFFSGRIVDSYSERASSSRTAGEKAKLRRKLSKPVWEYYEQFYYDTAVGLVAAIRCGYEVFGSKKLIFSTDYPWGEDGGRARLSSYPEMIRHLNLQENERAEIFGENIRKLLKM